MLTALILLLFRDSEAALAPSSEPCLTCMHAWVGVYVHVRSLRTHFTLYTLHFTRLRTLYVAVESVETPNLLTYRFTGSTEINYTESGSLHS